MSRRTRVGDLRHRVQIQKYTEVEDGGHGTVRNWVTLSTVFADIRAVGGLVTFDTQQIDKKITHKIRIRYQPYISSERWLLMNGRRFRVRNVVNVDERNQWLDLLCEEVFKIQEPFIVGSSTVGQALIEGAPAEDV